MTSFNAAMLAVILDFLMGACQSHVGTEYYQHACRELSPSPPPPRVLRKAADSALAQLLGVRAAVRERGEYWSQAQFEAELQRLLRVHAVAGSRREVLEALLVAAARRGAELDRELGWTDALLVREPEAAHAVSLMALPPDSDEWNWRRSLVITGLEVQQAPPSREESRFYKYAFCRLMILLGEEARRPASPDSVALGLDTPSVVVPGWLLTRLWRTERSEERTFVRAALNAAPGWIGDHMRQGFESGLRIDRERRARH